MSIEQTNKQTYCVLHIPFSLIDYMCMTAAHSNRNQTKPNQAKWAPIFLYIFVFGWCIGHSMIYLRFAFYCPDHRYITLCTWYIANEMLNQPIFNFKCTAHTIDRNVCICIRAYYILVCWMCVCLLVCIRLSAYFPLTMRHWLLLWFGLFLRWFHLVPNTCG